MTYGGHDTVTYGHTTRSRGLRERDSCLALRTHREGYHRPRGVLGRRLGRHVVEEGEGRGEVQQDEVGQHPAAGHAAAAARPAAVPRHARPAHHGWWRQCERHRAAAHPASPPPLTRVARPVQTPSVQGAEYKGELL